MIMQKVSNMEIYYRAVDFYLYEHPLQLNSLLSAIAGKVDHARVVQQLRKSGHLALALPYLKTVQQHNIATVNDAINELYAESEQYDELRQSIEEFDNFDQIGFAQKVEQHELKAMRRIAALVYKKNERFKKSIELSQADKMYKDAMDTARDSESVDLCEGLLQFFVENNLKECFAACLYTCYDNIRPDVALELAWRKGMIDYVMPYLIQMLREYTSRIDALDKKTQKKEEAEEKNKSAPNDFVPDWMPGMMPGPSPLMGNLAIMGPSTMAPQQMPQPGMVQPGMAPQACFPGMMPGQRM